MSFHFFIENDQLVESRGREELNAGEIEEQIFARFLLHQSEQLITELLNISGINDFAVEKANHRDIARAASQIGDFNTTMNSHTKTPTGLPQQTRAKMLGQPHSSQSTAYPTCRRFAIPAAERRAMGLGLLTRGGIA